jgi:MoxR-like ATPase
MEEPVFQSRVDLTTLNEQVKRIKEEIGRVIVGQETMVELLITAILADGHVLIEGVQNLFQK